MNTMEFVIQNNGYLDIVIHGIEINHPGITFELPSSGVVNDKDAAISKCK